LILLLNHFAITLPDGYSLTDWLNVA